MKEGRRKGRKFVGLKGGRKKSSDVEREEEEKKEEEEEEEEVEEKVWKGKTVKVLIKKWRK